MNDKCNCKEPKLQKYTRECGICKNYIDRVKHIILTEDEKTNQKILR